MVFNSKILWILICTMCIQVANAQEPFPRIVLEQVFSGLSSPVSLQSCNDNRIFIVEKAGVIKIGYPDGTIRDSAFLDITDRVTSGGERGLLGLAFPPDYKHSGVFYVNYTGDSDARTIISRFRISQDSNKAIEATEEKLLTIKQPYANHNGGNIEFGPDGYLYIGMGDGGSGGDPQNNSQNKKSLLGKMLRLDVSQNPGYKIPTDNPFVGNPDYSPEIWSLGLRNPWRFKFDERNGNMWIADVGQNKWEEIDFEAAGNGGKNYGWRCYEGFESYNLAGCEDALSYEFPVVVFDHDAGHCSITGGVIDIKDPNSSLYGYYYSADYCSGQFWGTKRNADLSFSTIELANPGFGKFVAFGYDQEKNIYVARDNGRIYRLDTFVLCAPALNIVSDGPEVGCKIEEVVLSTQYFPNGIYTWYKDGDPIDGITIDTLHATEPGNYTVQFVSETCSAVTDTAYRVRKSTAIDVNILDIPEEYCLNGAPLVFHGTPEGGSFFGTGMVDSVFYPSISNIGTFFITYSYEDAEGCNGFDVGTIRVNNPPGAVILSAPPTLCLQGPPYPLEAIPEEGYWTGDGISGNTFYPVVAGVGVHKMKYTFNPWPGCYGYDSIFIKVIDCNSAVFENEQMPVKIYPNPSQDIISIRTNFKFNAPLDISLLNSFGKAERIKYLVQEESGYKTIILSLEHLPAGVYPIIIQYNGRQYVEKIVKL